MSTEFKINIHQSLMSTLDFISKEYKDIELGGYLLGDIKNGEIYLNNILFPSQNISKTHLEITAEHQLELRRKYGKKCNRILGHWHSHNDMGAFFSETDESLMDSISKNKKLFVFIVSSLGNHKIRTYLNKPLKIVFDNCDYNIFSWKLNMLKQKIKKIILLNTRNDIDDEQEEETNDNLYETN